MSERTRSIPASPSAWAILAPMPLAAPVITAGAPDAGPSMAVPLVEDQRP